MFGKLRNKDYFRKLSIKKDGKIIFTKDIKVLIPERHESINMFKFDKVIECSGVWYMHDDDMYYTVSIIPGVYRLYPTMVVSITIENVKYYELTFKANSIFSDEIVSMRKEPMFGIFTDYIIKGKIPAFLTPDDLENLINNGSKYCDKKFGGVEKTTEFIMSIMVRLKKDKNLLYRHYPDTPIEELTYVGLSDMTYNYSTTSKLTHNYFKDGVISTISNSNEDVTKQDMILSNQY